MAYLDRLWIYPIKSLDGISLDSCSLLSSGALQGDRRWALFDSEGKFINGKNNPKIHLIRSHWTTDLNTLTLQIQDKTEKAVFQLDRDRLALESWFSDYFGLNAQLKENTVMGYPDDTQACGATIISTATLETVASWFPDLSVAEMRRRFRANLEIADVPPFWEDRLFNRLDEAKSFKIGNVLFWGINPCQRCIVPTRDSYTGVGNKNFTRIFTTKRQATLPPWTNRDRFNHFYRLSVNTQVPPSEAGKVIQKGDLVGC
jgi:hypothetical protein